MLLLNRDALVRVLGLQAGEVVTTWVAAEVGLFTDDIVPTDETPLTDLTEPTWTGYARQAITWETAARGTNGYAELLGGSVNFASGTDANETVYGAFLVDSAGALIGIDRFPDPIPVVGVQNIPYLPRINALAEPT